MRKTLPSSGGEIGISAYERVSRHEFYMAFRKGGALRHRRRTAEVVTLLNGKGE